MRDRGFRFLQNGALEHFSTDSVLISRNETIAARMHRLKINEESEISLRFDDD